MLDPSALELALTTLQSRIDQLHQSLAQQNKLATLGMVTAVIAHEFNNILTPMIAYTKFALGNSADDALRTKALNKALSGAERLANISKSLLGFARGDETSTVAHVATAVRETLACLSRDLGKDGITLSCEIPEDLWVSMNAGHLQQVLMNLIVNARSAMLHRAKAPATAACATEAAKSCGKTNEAEHFPSVTSRQRALIESRRKAPVGSRSIGAGTGTGGGGGVKRLTIRAAIVEGTAGTGELNKKVELSIADTGPGIPADVLPRIFDPFFSTKKRGEAKLSPEQGGDVEAMPQGGTGLGLTICRELVVAAGGQIRATSEAGRGATFILELVVVPAPSSSTGVAT